VVVVLVVVCCIIGAPVSGRNHKDQEETFL